MKLHELQIEVLGHDKLWALYDKKDLKSENDFALKKRGAFSIDESEAKDANDAGFGIFVTVNKFKDYVRRISNLESIRSWSIDIDHKDWRNLKKLIEKSLMPSLVIRTKNGYQIWWFAKDATIENYHDIVSDRLVETFSGDRRAKDVARLLRAPGFYHLKNPSEPYLIEEIFFKPVSYTEEQMFEYFEIPYSKKKKIDGMKEVRSVFGTADNSWARVSDMNCEIALSKLSGTPEVLGEKYGFKNNSNGTKQIFVDGRSTSCWIDHAGLIGSHDKGGPTIFQWINWYQEDYEKSKKIFMKYFGENKNEV